jgi:hypothetical protein
MEATTDPLPFTAPAYDTEDGADLIWAVEGTGGGEIGDMCERNPSSLIVSPSAFLTPPGYAYEVQRGWSNAAAAAGHDPCQPTPAGVPYFNATAQLNASVDLLGSPTEGLLIPMNTPQTVEVDLYSDGPLAGDADWTVSASDLSNLLGGGPYLSFAWDATTGKNGTKLHLTITPRARTAYGGEPFYIVSQQGTVTNYWMGFVAQ